MDRAVDEDGVLSRDEAQSAASSGVRAKDGRSLIDAFNAIDTDGSGSIDKGELLRAVQNQDTVAMIRSEKFLEPLLNPKTFATFFKKMDLNQDGKVDFEEFNNALNHALGANTPRGTPSTTTR